jgi:hypothetical protein
MSTPGGAEVRVTRPASIALNRSPRLVAMLACAGLAIAVPGPGAALAQCMYSAQVIAGPPCPFAGQAALIGTGMSNTGAVVGYWMHCDDPGYEAFYWTEQTGLITLPRPANVWRATAADVNDHNIIVGVHWITGVGERGYVYDMNNPQAGFTYLEPLHGVGISGLSAINNSGIAVGWRSIGKPGQSPNPYNALIWRPFEKGAPVEDLGVLSGPNSSALAVSAAGVAVGWTGQSVPSTNGVIWSSSTPLVLDPVPGMDTSHCWSSNDSGTIIGSAFNSSTLQWRAFVWTETNTNVIEPLPSWTSTRSRAVNELEQIGILLSSGSQNQRAALWQHGQLYVFGDLVVELGGLVLNSVADINNGGATLSNATLQGAAVAAVLSPLDPPFTDLDLNCVTNFFDLLLLLRQWGPIGSGAAPAPGAPSADLNGDGKVDVFDLLILLGNWG